MQLRMRFTYKVDINFSVNYVRQSYNCFCAVGVMYSMIFGFFYE